MTHRSSFLSVIKVKGQHKTHLADFKKEKQKKKLKHMWKKNLECLFYFKYLKTLNKKTEKQNSKNTFSLLKIQGIFQKSKSTSSPKGLYFVSQT